MKAVKTLALAVFMGFSLHSIAQTNWTLTAAPIADWISVACSADGTKAYATANRIRLYNGNSTITGTYLSTNSGVTGMMSASTNGFDYIATDADGSRLIGIKAGGGASKIFISGDSGANWGLATTFAGNPGSVALSADGRVALAGSASITSLLLSTNYGSTWATISGMNGQTFVACSADGTRLFGVGSSYISGGSQIEVSTNGGVTWKTHPPFATWTSIACSADGKRTVASAYNGVIYTSTNYGTTWVTNNVPTAAWTWVASSADGTKLAAVIGGTTAVIYTSADSGSTWISNSVSSQKWTGIATSADGSKLIASADVGTAAGGVYNAYTPPSPRISLAGTNNQLALSWLVPSTNFVLQSSTNLSETLAWADLTNAPIFNLTNLYEEIALPLPEVPAFYRLKTP